jgi:hypothetical protein
MSKPKNKDMWLPHHDGGERLVRNGRETPIVRYPSTVDNAEALVKILTAVEAGSNDCDEFVVRLNPNGQWDWWPHS